MDDGRRAVSWRVECAPTPGPCRGLRTDRSWSDLELLQPLPFGVRGTATGGPPMLDAVRASPPEPLDPYAPMFVGAITALLILMVGWLASKWVHQMLLKVCLRRGLKDRTMPWAQSLKLGRRSDENKAKSGGRVSAPAGNCGTWPGGRVEQGSGRQPWPFRRTPPGVLPGRRSSCTCHATPARRRSHGRPAVPWRCSSRIASTRRCSRQTSSSGAQEPPTASSPAE